MKIALPVHRRCADPHQLGTTGSRQRGRMTIVRAGESAVFGETALGGRPIGGACFRRVFRELARHLSGDPVSRCLGLDRLAGHLGRGDFYTLPRISDVSPLNAPVHVLEVAPWRGIFLISPDGTTAAGLVFSRAPHDMRLRFEIATDFARREWQHVEEDPK